MSAPPLTKMVLLTHTQLKGLYSAEQTFWVCKHVNMFILHQNIQYLHSCLFCSCMFEYSCITTLCRTYWCQDVVLSSSPSVSFNTIWPFCNKISYLNYNDGFLCAQKFGQSCLYLFLHTSTLLQAIKHEIPILRSKVFKSLVMHNIGPFSSDSQTWAINQTKSICNKYGICSCTSLLPLSNSSRVWNLKRTYHAKFTLWAFLSFHSHRF